MFKSLLDLNFVSEALTHFLYHASGQTFAGQKVRLNYSVLADLQSLDVVRSDICVNIQIELPKLLSHLCCHHHSVGLPRLELQMSKICVLISDSGAVD